MNLIERRPLDVPGSLIAEVKNVLGTVRSPLEESSYARLDFAGVGESEARTAAWCEDTRTTLERLIPRIREPHVTLVVSEQQGAAFHVQIRALVDLHGQLVPAEIDARSHCGQRWRLRVQRTGQDIRARLLDELDDLLGTLVGSLPGEPHYGVPDISAVYESRADAARAWCEHTRRALQRFVPILREPSVVQVPHEDFDLTFHVQIGGHIEQHGHRTPVTIDARSIHGRPWRLR